MRAPAFWWYPDPTFIARCLQPIGALYGGVTSLRMKRQNGISPNRPLICVGNFIAGGAGKTPVAIALAQRIMKRERSVSFLTRGYGGRLSGPTFLPHDRPIPPELTHQEVGDEALLLARHAPVMVARNRSDGLKDLLAHPDASPDVVIMDDGLQNPSVVKTLTFAVVDGDSGIGNGLCIPAGPLRAPFSKQLPHVDALIIIGQGSAGEEIADIARRQNKHIFYAHLSPDQKVARSIRGRRVLAFAGIGRPEKFFNMLERLGAEVIIRRAFSDHAPFTEAQLAALEYEAMKQDLLPVTTEKDAVRISGMQAAPHLRTSLAVLPVHIIFDEEEELQNYMARAIT